MNPQHRPANNVNSTTQILRGLVLAAAILIPRLSPGAGPEAVDLGTASHFTILGGTAVVSAGGTVDGDVGLSPATGAAITGMLSTQVNGVIYVVDAFGPAGSVNNPALLTVAVNDLTAAYTDAANRTNPATVYAGPGEIGGSNLGPDLYKFTTTATISTDLTLTGGPDDVWIFQVGTGLTVGSGVNIILAGGAQAKNIFWQVGSSATIGTGSNFKGTIMAGASITLDTTSVVDGRALAFAQVTFNGRHAGMSGDYTVVKTVITPPGGAALVGDAVVFQITITNTGEVNMVTIPVEDLYLTNYLSFVVATPATVDTINDGVLNWANVGPLAPGASTNLFVSFLAVGSSAGLWETNIVVVSPTNAPVRTNGAPYSTDSADSPGYIVGKTVVNPLGRPSLLGESITFQITVLNTGDVALATLPLEDQYSTNFLSFVSSTTAPDNAVNDGILNWTDVGTLAPGASTNIFVTFTVVGSTAGMFETNLVVASPAGLPVKTNGAPYNTSQPGYTVEKTVTTPANGPAQVGGTVEFQITVVNTGDVTLVTVPVEDRYSTSILSFVGATPATFNNINDGILNWPNVGPLAPGGSITITVTFTAVGSTAGLPATNVVVVSPAGVPVQSNSAPYSTSSPGYTITKTAVSPLGGGASAGDTIVFRITVVNTGDVTMATIPLEDRYPVATLTFVNATPLTVDSVNDGVLNWANVGPLAPGATTNIFVAFTALGDTTGNSVANLVVASPPGLPIVTNTAPYSVSPSVPTPVVLKSFSAVYDGQSVLVAWDTGVELNNLGFNVYRSTSVDGVRAKVNAELIPGLGTSEGTHYELSDSVQDSTLTYYYWLEDVAWNFATELHGPSTAVPVRGVAGPAPINLGSCSNFVILAHTTVTSPAGAGYIYGNVGLDPAGSMLIPPALIIGTIYNGGPIAAQAQLDLTTAFNAASPAQLPGGINVGNGELGGRVLAPGVYQSAPGSYAITSLDLTLNGGPDDVWVFQMASTLTVGVGRQVILTGGAQAKNVFWQVGSSATLGVSSVFKGTIMAAESITMNGNSTADGRALARNGAVTWGGSSGSLPTLDQGLHNLKLYWQLPAGQVACWLLNANGTRKSGINTYTNATTWEVRCGGDINKDGTDDLIWQLPAGQATCWFMNTNGTREAGTNIYTLATPWAIRGAGDVDGDGVADLFWQLPSGQAACWFMNTDGTRKSGTNIYTGSTTWIIRGAGDVDGDGVADLIWQLPTGQAACWFMNADGTRKSGADIYTGPTTWIIRTAGDVDGDGIPDLIWQLPTGEAACWFMNADATMRSMAYIHSTPTPWVIRGSGL